MRNTTALVLAGGATRGFSVLTHNRAKSALPICGHYRIIDYVLSNLSLSGIDSVGVVIQYLPGSLIDHVGTGRAYDLDTANRTFKLMPPFVGMGKTEWFRGTADAIFQNLNFVYDTRADLVLVLSGDHVYSMDYDPLIHFHRTHNADLTIATRTRPSDTPAEVFGYVRAEADGRVREFLEKPQTPPHDTVSMGIYLFDARVLCEQLELLQGSQNHNLPADVVQPLVRSGRVFSFPFHDEWYYLANLEAYVQLHRRLLAGESLAGQGLWHVMTNLRDRELGSRPSPYFGHTSRVRESLISPGCVIEGTVLRSVLSPGVYVAANAVVRDSILFHDCQVREGAGLIGIVSDKDACFHPYCHVGGEHAGDDASRRPPLTVVGKGAEIAQGVRVGPGVHLPIGEIVSQDLAAPTERPAGAERAQSDPAQPTTPPERVARDPVALRDAE